MNPIKSAIATAQIASTIFNASQGPMPLDMQYAQYQNIHVPAQISQAINLPPQYPTTSGR
jgi:hypothetical protein